MKALDTDFVFDNYDQALDFVLSKEQEKMANDPMFQTEPMLLVPHDPKRPPLKLGPHVSYWNHAKEDDFVLTRLQSGRYSLKPNLRGRKFLFRGQTAFYDNCTPILFRKEKPRYTADLIHGQEMMLLTLSHPMVRLLDSKINLLGYDFTFEMNLYGLNQHYYNKTNLLDLSSDTNVAGFFATNEHNPNDDTYKPVTDDSKIGVLYYYDVDTNNGFVFYGLSTIGLQVFPRSGCQKGFLKSIAKGMNFNDDPRVKWVFFKHNAQISERYSQMFNQGRSLFPDDILATHWKNRDDGIISDRTILLNMIMNDHKESKSKVTKELSERGLSIRKYIPSFTQDELHQYYQDIKNGYWQNWCERIYFEGDRNDAFKNALKSVVDDPQYGWAFVEGKNGQMPTDGFLSSIYPQCLM
ncbi:MAG: FRG domain-containing protein [Bacteroidales bacterium]|nr:FRG domain-containing protein [Candidatus Cryptobacteroides choladohippi]